MKKTIALLLSLIIVALCLNSCSSIFIPDNGMENTNDSDQNNGDTNSSNSQNESDDSSLKLTISDTYKSPMKKEYDPTTYYKAGNTFNFNKLSEEEEYYTLLSENSDLDVVVTVYAEIKQYGKYERATTVQFGMGPEILVEQEFESNSNTYTPISLSYTVKAKRLTTQGIYMKFFWQTVEIDSHGLVQNVYYTIEFAKQGAE